MKDGNEESEDAESDYVNTFGEELGELLNLAAQIMAVIGMKPVVANRIQSTSIPSRLRTWQLHPRARRPNFLPASDAYQAMTRRRRFCIRPTYSEEVMHKTCDFRVSSRTLF